MDKNSIGKYSLYALGEIVLIIIGILIAVGINNHVIEKQNTEIRCIYLNELVFTLDYDVKDVEENIVAFNIWNPMIREVHDALQGTKKLETIDSLYLKLGTIGNFIFFGQHSKTKIEELKFSDITLIGNRELKNKILLYQDQRISFLRVLEHGYDLIGEDLRKYYVKNFIGFNYGSAYPLDIKALEKDNAYRSLVLQRLRSSLTLAGHYNMILEEQEEIKKMLKEELSKICGD